MMESSSELIYVPIKPLGKEYVPSAPRAACPGSGYVIDHIVELGIFTTLYAKYRDTVSLKQARLDFTVIALALNQPWNLQWLTPEQNKQKSEYIRKCMTRVSRPAAWPVTPGFARNRESGAAFEHVKNPRQLMKLLTDGAPKEFLKGPNKDEFIREVSGLCAGLYDTLRA